jgi:CO/xanthine dehydrogenase FAD-binding subunit
MTVVMAHSLDEVLDAFDSSPEATLLAGGTDVMVEVNEGHRRFPGGDDAVVVAISGVPELNSYRIDPDRRVVELGAGVRWREVEREPLRDLLPALAQAARTVGSPQIRHAGTIGGNLATCSPAGDGLPVLAATESTVHLVSRAGRRAVPVGEFMVGVKRTALAQGELIERIDVPLLDGWQGYSKVGVRNAMVIATASVCLATDTPTRSIRIALGSVGPTVLRCPQAEAAAVAAVDWVQGSIDADAAGEIGRLAATESRPIDDHRSTASYRRHAVGVMVARHLQRAFPGEADR